MKMDKRAWLVFGILVVVVIVGMAMCLPARNAEATDTTYVLDTAPANQKPIDFRMRGDRTSRPDATGDTGICWRAQKPWKALTVIGTTTAHYGYDVTWCNTVDNTRIKGSPKDLFCERYGGFYHYTGSTKDWATTFGSRRLFICRWNFWYDAPIVGSILHTEIHPHVEAYVHTNGVIEGTVWFK